MTGSDDRQAPPVPHPGLVIRHAPPKVPRPGAGPGPATPVVAASRPFATILLTTHRDLLVHQAAIAARIAAEPRLSLMLMINPVLALERLGVTMSPGISHHVLHTLQHPKEVRDRRDVLEKTLREALGEPARPNEPPWNAHLLFKLRKLPPLDIGARLPTYTPPLGQEESQPLQALRPPGTHRYPYPRRLPPRAHVSSVPWKESLRRIDLDAPVPKLPHAKTTSKEVPLEDLWFYKDLDPLVHDALELGAIRRVAFPIHGPDRFRRILEGKEANAFLLWIDRLSFKATPR
jgi:hypothetical protein